MKKSKFTDEQIAFALKQAEVGTPVEEVCRKMGISDATFYNWRKKYGGLGPSDLPGDFRTSGNLRGWLP
jgi:putative transposase